MKISNADLNFEIFALTQTIQQDYPELYEHLNETPIDVSPGDTESLIRYLETLQSMLSSFAKTHPPEKIALYVP